MEDNLLNNSKNEEAGHITLPSKVVKGENSIFLTIIFWIRMTMGVGVLTIPYYICDFGIMGGVICLVLGAIICGISFRFIMEASIITKKNSYSELVETLIPKLGLIFKISYTAEIILLPTCYVVTSWNLFKYILYIFDFYKDDWIIDQDKLDWDEYNGEVFLIRFLFFLILFIIISPLLFKKNITKLKNVSILFLLNMLILLVILLIECPYFKNYYSEKRLLKVEYGIKTPTMEWIPTFFSMMTSYYLQPFTLTLKDELKKPTLKRINTVSFFSCLIEAIIFIFFGILCYSSFGDLFTPTLMILRKPYENKPKATEIILQVGVGCFFLLNNIGLSIYNIGIRNHLSSLIKMENQRNKFILCSLIAFIFSFTFTILLPSLTFLFWFLGLVISNLNGYIIPSLLKISILKSKLSLKAFLLYLLVLFYVFCGIAGTYQKLK